MKKLIIATSAAFLFLSTGTIAQTTAVPATEQPSVQNEIRTTSGQLKEAYAAVSQQLTQLNKEIGADAAQATEAQAAQRTKLTTALSQIEGMLSTVNTADEKQWSAIKAKAETVRTEALKLTEAKGAH